MRRSDSVTRLRITVGTFDSPENRVAAQQIYDKMKSQGEANSTAGKPS
jgi:hypothetical protein